MIEATRECARLLEVWVDTFDSDAEKVALALGEAPEARCQEVLKQCEQRLQNDAVSRVIVRAHDLLPRSPRDAQRLARLALRMTRHLKDDPSRDLPLIEGDAWRECAAAHLELSEFADAYDAVTNARACYSRTEASRINATILALIEGRTLYELGKAKEALAIVDRASTELLDLSVDRKKYVQARTIYASILAGMADYDAALDVFSAAADFAMKAGDQQTLAYVLSNAGLCAAKLEDYPRARKCFNSALQYFADLGLVSEMPHVRAALVTILRQQGRYNEAVSELYKVRAEFLSLGIPVAAAIASLRIVEVLLLCGRTRDVPELCDEMFQTFASARLQNNLLLALGYLSEIARERELAASDVTYVASFMEEAEHNPDQEFAPA
ncbi:MAG: hypothetical protein JO093_05640 [Acidobacteria bacterium]|nr:hypothetical protein [Acidobacteriota bacterium]MBV9068069.1 hypothetical protein [Acidobacteriota bacterium]MBV9185080.1 hypothetical protein [Acidobacteriota bacterium]